MSSSSYRIDDLSGDFADSFFNGDFHADCNIATTVKSKSSQNGALKFTWVNFPSFSPTIKFDQFLLSNFPKIIESNPKIESSPRMLPR